MKISIAITAIICIGFFSNCTYENREDLQKVDSCELEEVTFSDNVQRILSTRCGACHGASLQEAGVSMLGHENVLKIVNNGKLLKVINHAPGFPQMPQGGPKLPDCEIKQIQKWVDEGALNN